MGIPEETYESYYDSIVANETLLENLTTLLNQIKTKKFLKAKDIRGVQKIIEDIENYKLVRSKDIEENTIVMQSMRKRINELLVTLGHAEDKELLDKYTKLTADYKDIKMKLVDMSVELAIEAGKNTDKSFSIEKLNNMNNYLTSRVQYLRNVITTEQANTQEEKHKDEPIPEYRIKERLQFNLSSDFEDLQFTFSAELLNQHIMYDSFIYKSITMEETVSNAFDFFISGGVSEDVYIITLLNNSVFSRFNITEAIARITEDSLYNIENLNKFIVVKSICRQIEKLNKKVYNNLKEIDVSEF